MEGHRGGLPYPKKKFGQHFLKDGNMLRKIVATARVVSGDVVLEIGPGRGALTEALINAGARVVAIEIDAELAEYLSGKFPTEALEIIREDALKADFISISEKAGAKLKVVSNLPYNISGPIIAKFLKERSAFTLMVLMLQKEVATRLAAKPSTKEYGVLSVLSQVYADVKVEFPVPRHMFLPPPRVDSSIISYRFLEKPRVDIPDEAFFASVVKAAFSQRRKTLLNALGTLSLGAGKDEVAGALKNAGIDPKRRGETLSLGEFAALSRELFNLKM